MGSSVNGSRRSAVIAVVAIVLIVAGLLGLTYRKFSYTREAHDARLGPLQLSIKEQRTVDIPAWAGVAAVTAGVVLLLVRAKR